MMVALRNGETLRKFAVRSHRLKAYFDANPGYAEEAKPLIEANAIAALLRKGARRDNTHCKYGHPLFGRTVYIRRNGKRQCLICAKRRDGAPPPPSAEQLKQVTAALNAGKPLRLICAGMIGPKRRATPIVSYIKLNAYRRQNPAFNQFVLSATVSNNSRGQQRRHNPEAFRVQVVRTEANDFYKILSLVPAGLPADARDDIAQSIMLALLEGVIQRDQVRTRVRHFVAEHNRVFPTKFAKFGDSQLLSLDEVMFEDGSATRGDTVSRGLWDSSPVLATLTG
ncbi:hypothetical protein [Bradyrhizobium valentinum]|nr:hypothetical protein [Bradyrhizobium valentinum]